MDKFLKLGLILIAFLHLTHRKESTINSQSDTNPNNLEQLVTRKLDNIEHEVKAGSACGFISIGLATIALGIAGFVVGGNPAFSAILLVLGASLGIAGCLKYPRRAKRK